MGHFMLVKVIVVILFFLILASLGSGLVYLVKDKGQTKRTANALTLRIAISLLAFLLLILGYITGLIQPHGISG